jgi:hypothetical protein
MSPEHPSGLPELFLDRSLGRVQVPRILRAAGLRIYTLAEVYGVPADEEVADVDWLEYAGRQGWAAFMKDERIRYRPAERAVVVAHDVQAFFLTNGNLRAADMAARYLAVIDQIAAACGTPGPFLYAVARGTIRRVEL